MKYKWEGRGERVVTAEDFASVGVEHADVYFTEDNGYTLELSDEAAEAMVLGGDRLIPIQEQEPEDPAAEGGGEPSDEETTTKPRSTRKPRS